MSSSTSSALCRQGMFTRASSAVPSHTHASSTVHAHHQRCIPMRASPAAHAHAHRRRFMRTRAAPITGSASAHVHSRWGGFVAVYLSRLANLRCSRSLRVCGASADGSSARGSARRPCRRLDWWFRHGSSPSTMHLRLK